MAFFLIVPSVMIVSVILVHALANRLGLRIFYPTLIAVMVLSFMVVGATGFVTPAIGREYLFRLALMIVMASSLLTMANKFLIKQQLAAEKSFDEEVKAAYEEEKRKSAAQKLANEKISAPVDNIEWNVEDTSLEERNFSPEETSQPVEESPQPVEEIPQPVEETPQPVEETSQPVGETPQPVEETSQPVEEIDEPLENHKPPENFPLEEVFKPLSDIKPKEADKPIKLEKKSAPEENFPLEEVFKPLAEVKPKEADKPIETKETPKQSENFPLQEVFRPLSTLNLDKLEKITKEEKTPPPEVELESAETLDDLLDKAYNERDKGHIWQAIEIYKKALERYRNDEYAPFVAIDLGNIYKEQALYSKAIKTYEEALALPAVKRNDSVKKEFTTTLAYMRIARDVLLKYHALSTPFGKLSKEILQEIDAEFKKAQINSAQ